MQELGRCRKQSAQLIESSISLLQHIKKRLEPGKGRVDDEVRQNLEDLKRCVRSLAVPSQH